MADGFDINDRDTWAWNDVHDVAVKEDDYLLNPLNAGSYYQVAKGVLVLRPCGASTVFDPTFAAGPTCSPPSDGLEARIYAWAVARGQVTDQR
ncbi:hypothetical protein AB0G79_11465 [Streptomyces sp. NPDC020807]|uniref:hypothetical protein n=1 Tax=Streptomyces sp. NPDC020807 TaxID=3155119 RepID=UPI0033D48CD8